MASILPNRSPAHTGLPGDGRSPIVRLIGAHPLIPALVIAIVVSAIRARGTVDSDVSWQLWIARHLHSGAHLYRDIVETNPPLWFWMAVPVDRLAALVGARSDAILVLAIGAIAILSLLATAPSLTNIASRRRAAFLAYAALILTAMPGMHVGQREQIVLIGSLPYAALLAVRREGRAVKPGFAALVGAGAALGFALKHYFLVVPILLELWLLAGQRKGWRAVRPETLAIAAIGSCYALATLIWGRDFLTQALPLLRLAYGVTGAPRLADLFQPAVLVSLVMLALAAAQIRPWRGDAPGFASAMAVAAFGFGLSYFVQAKGWPYHALPLLGCSALALAASLAQVVKAPRLVAVTAPALLCLPLVIALQEVRREPLPAPDLRRAIAGLRAGDSVGFVATDPALGWSVTLQNDLRYASRYNGFWMMRAVVRNEALGGPDPLLTELGRRVVRETVVDFLCTPPRRIIVARPTPAARAKGEFDILPFFLRDPAFAELLGHYRLIGRTSIEVYERTSPLPPIVRTACRTGI